jgi:hypothetical protein
MVREFELEGDEARNPRIRGCRPGKIFERGRYAARPTPPVRYEDLGVGIEVEVRRSLTHTPLLESRVEPREGRLSFTAPLLAERQMAGSQTAASMRPDATRP